MHPMITADDAVIARNAVIDVFRGPSPRMQKSLDVRERGQKTGVVSEPKNVICTLV